MRIVLIVWIFLISVPAVADMSIEYELDPYYSNIGAYVPLTDQPIEEVDLEKEERIYRKILKDALTPKFFLAELSVNPLPILGTWLKDQQQGFYDQGEIDDDFNLIQALTEGFEEPYAVSLFVGNIIRFKLPDQPPKAINKGYFGYVISLGDQHIKDNVLIDDDWYEIEIKLKGDRRLGTVYHSWSYRIGVKRHDNREIADTRYFGIRRELFNSEVKSYRLLENIGIDLRVDFSDDNLKLVQSQLIVEKQWPASAGVFSLGVGLNSTRDKYTGSLADDEADTSLILRPGFKF
ncbi:MAG: hypothetical protein QNJ69_05730 [Gammaproteobacteria bacterium]|nr:hypothetical protein [Gammaproteobacteria bacterium]